MARVTRPEAVVIGVERFPESLVVIEVDRARRLADEIDAVKACTTIGDALSLAPTLTAVHLPGLEDLQEDEELGPDDPWDWSEQSAVADGDWPPMASSLIFTTFDQSDHELWDALAASPVEGRRDFTALNGDVYTIATDRADALIATLTALGIQATRDDALIARISPE